MQAREKKREKTKFEASKWLQARNLILRLFGVSGTFRPARRTADRKNSSDPASPTVEGRSSDARSYRLMHGIDGRIQKVAVQKATTFYLP